MCTHHKAGGESEHVGDGVLHGPGLLVDVDVSEHHAVHERSQQEVDMADEDHAQSHLHQGLGFLQAGTTRSWGGEGRGGREAPGSDILKRITTQTDFRECHPC